MLAQYSAALQVNSLAGLQAPAEGRMRKLGVDALDVAAPVGVVVGVRCELVALGRPRLPPRRPVVVEAVAVGLGALGGGEEGDAHVLALEHLGHQRRDAHVAGVEGQVDRLVAGLAPGVAPGAGSRDAGQRQREGRGRRG